MVDSECTGNETPDMSDVDLITVLHALSDPIRLDIVRQIAASSAEMMCGMINIPVTKSTGSHHFKILFKAGILSERPQGTKKLMSLRRAELDDRFPGLLDSVLAAVETVPSKVH